MNLKPDIYVRNIYEINEEHFKGAKLLCFDLDNTLDIVDNIDPVEDEKLRIFISQLEKKGYKIYVFSNNKIKNRVASFANLYNLEYKEAASKPFQKKYKNDEILNKFCKQDIIFIGDKLITDIFGAKLYGCKSILVDPIEQKATKWYSFVMNVSDKLYEKLINFKRGEYYES